MASPFVTGKGPEVVAVSIVFLFIAYIAVTLRLWSRQLVKRPFHIHDYLISLGLLLTTAVVICLILNVKHGGLGQTGETLMRDPANYMTKLTYFGKILVIVQPLWAFAMTSIRLATLNLYAHLFSVHPRFRRACWIVASACVIWLPCDLVACFMICQPVAFNWDPTIPGGKCGDTAVAYISMHVSNVVIDASIALLPVPVLWGLKMDFGKRVAIIVMFALGSLICAISIARISMFKKVDLKSPDFTYDAVNLYLFTALEPLLAITLACIPLLRPFSERIAESSALNWVKSLRSSMTSSKGSTAHSGQKSGQNGDASGSSSLSDVPLHPHPVHQVGQHKIVVTSEVKQKFENRDSFSTGEV